MPYIYDGEWCQACGGDQEAAEVTSLDIIKVLRARRLSYLGHILRANEDRLLHIAIGQMQADQKDGGLLMDAPEHSSIAELSAPRPWLLQHRALLFSMPLGHHP